MKELIIDWCDFDYDKCAEDIGSCFLEGSNLLKLTLCSVESKRLHQIANLTQLESLNISSNDESVDDEVLTAIAANCKLLKIVNISGKKYPFILKDSVYFSKWYSIDDIFFLFFFSGCYKVTNAGLSQIVSLPELKSLDIAYLWNITDEVLSCIPKLISLDCSYCSRISDKGLIRLIESSEVLEFLNVVNCECITNELLEAAVSATKLRKNNVVLKIYVIEFNFYRNRESRINFDKPMINASPFLKILVSAINIYKYSLNI